MRDGIRFFRRGRLVEVRDFAPSTMLLDYLREAEGARGSKEGCGDGGCGACTVAIGRLRNGALVYEPVNACIQLLGMIDGAEVLTVEDLADDDGSLHPVQTALVTRNAIQCGFCAPGFAMSLFTLFHDREQSVTRELVEGWIAGNLCRCTGYRSIVDAALDTCAGARRDRFSENAPETIGLLSILGDDDDLFVGNDDQFFAAPVDLDAFAALYAAHPDATIVAGATDVGPWVTKQLRDLDKVIHLGRIRGFDWIEETDEELRFGGGTTFAQAEPWLGTIDPDLAELVRRFGSKQIRASGTLAGNVAIGSPNADLVPPLIALDAAIELHKRGAVRSLPVERFLVDEERALAEGEFIAGLSVPKLRQDQLFRCYKVSKRLDQDVASVTAAVRFTIDESGHIAEARLAFGGLAPTARRAPSAEAALRGTQLRDSRAWAAAFAALRNDFEPSGDFRGSARYRSETAHALLGKALIESAGTASSRTRVVGWREDEVRAVS